MRTSVILVALCVLATALPKCEDGPALTLAVRADSSVLKTLNAGITLTAEEKWAYILEGDDRVLLSPLSSSENLEGLFFELVEGPAKNLGTSKVSVNLKFDMQCLTKDEKDVSSAVNAILLFEQFTPAFEVLFGAQDGRKFFERHPLFIHDLSHSESPMTAKDLHQVLKLYLGNEMKRLGLKGSLKSLSVENKKKLWGDYLVNLPALFRGHPRALMFQDLEVELRSLPALVRYLSAVVSRARDMDSMYVYQANTHASLRRQIKKCSYIDAVLRMLHGVGAKEFAYSDVLSVLSHEATAQRNLAEPNVLERILAVDSTASQPSYDCVGDVIPNVHMIPKGDGTGMLVVSSVKIPEIGDSDDNVYAEINGVKFWLRDQGSDFHVEIADTCAFGPQEL